MRKYKIKYNIKKGKYSITTKLYIIINNILY